jgi:hypothetical protein
MGPTHAVLVERTKYLLNGDAMIGDGFRLLSAFLVADAQPESACLANSLDSAFGDAGLSGLACEKEGEL